MSQRGDNDNFILGDDSENNPNPQNLATALIVIGQTTCKYVIELGAYINTDFGVAIFDSFITRRTHALQGPTVPEHCANLENRLNTLLTYRPYRPYTSFTPHNQDERHSSHSPHRVSDSTPLFPQSNIASLQSTTPAGPLYGHTKSLSPPATVPFMPTSHSSIPITSLDTSTSLVHPSSPTTTQVTTPDTSLNNACMDDAPVDDEPPCHANCEISMDQDMPTAALLPLIDPVTHPNPMSDIPTGSG